MRILTTFDSLAAMTSSGDAVGFPVSNVANLDPGRIWRASAFATAAWIRVDFGVTRSLDAVFLNRANFAGCTIQGNATDVWTAPTFSLPVSLVRDEAGNRKGWYSLLGFNFRFLRILIPLGTALDTGTLPQLGNLIVGTSIALPTATTLAVDLVGHVDRFESDGGTITPFFRGIQRHILNLTFRDPLVGMRGVPKGWQHAVIFENLGNASGSWLVFRPDRWSREVQNPLDSTLRIQLEERV